MKKMAIDYDDGCSIDFCAEDKKIIIESKTEFCAFDDLNKPVVDNNGETVFEYSGLASDDKNPDRSWAKACFIPKSKSSEHYHKIGTEDYYVIKGSAIVIVNGEEHRLSAGEHLQITPNQKHQVINSSEQELIILVRCKPSWTLGDYHLININIEPEIKQTANNSCLSTLHN